MRALIVSHGRAASCTVASFAALSPSSLAARKSRPDLARERRIFPAREEALFRRLARKRRAIGRGRVSRSSHSPSCAPRRDVEMRETLKTRRPNTQGKRTRRARSSRRLPALARVPSCTRMHSPNFELSSPTEELFVEFPSRTPLIGIVPVAHIGHVDHNHSQWNFSTESTNEKFFLFLY